MEDVAAPVITITTPADGATYSVGQTVPADYSCQEVGVAPPWYCDGPVADGDPIDTSVAGDYEFTVYAADDLDNQSSLTHHYTVVDQPPLATADSYATDEDTNLNVAAPGVLGNDTDPEGGSLSARDVTGPSHGSLVLNGDGSFSFTPDANFSGADSFTYVVMDEAGGESAETTVNITVNSRNDFPVATGDAYVTDEDTPVNVPAPGVLGNDTDEEGDVLTASLLTAPEHGTATVNSNGSFTYSPATNFNGTDSFTYEVRDGGPPGDEATVTITVNPVNDAPVAGNDAYTTAEDTALNVPAPGVLGNDSDVDGSALTATVVSGPSIGAVVLNSDGSFTYTPNANANGSDSFTYRAGDGTAQSNLATVNLTVNPRDDFPVATDDAYVTDEDTPLNVPAPGVLGNDTDVDGDVLTASLRMPAEHGTAAVNADGSFTYTPATNFNGTDSFTYKLDGGPLKLEPITATVTITVNAVNDAPVAVNDAYTTAEDTALNVPAPGVLGNDSDGDGSALSAAVVTGPSIGAVVLNSDGSITYTPTANANGSDAFTYRAGDGTAQSNVATVNITVVPVNDAPVAVDDASTTDEDIAVDVDVALNDTDVDNANADLRAVSVSSATGGTATLQPDGRTVRFVPATNANGVTTPGGFSFTYRAHDGALTSANTATVTITVNPVNDAPIAANDAYTTSEDTPMNILAPGVLGNDSDVDGSALSAAVITGPSIGSVVLNSDGSFTYTPTANANGADSFTYRADDGAAQSNVATVNITVVPVNDAPVAVDDASTTDEDATVDIDVAVNDTDVDNANANLRAVSVSAATGGTATLQPDGRAVRFLPAANANSINTPGGFSFTYRARDGALTSANTATVTITVNPVNDAPMLAPVPSHLVRWGNVLSVDADAIDVDVPADTLTYSLAAAPSGAGIDAATGVVTWTPTAAQVGTADFVVRVDDGGTPNLSAQTSFTVTVTRRPTLLVDSGDRTGQFSDPATVRATLTDNGGGALQGQPVSGKSVIFTIGSQTTTVTTNGSGVAQSSITLTQPAASPGVVALFAGDGAYLADTEVEPFTITPENATVAWSGPSLVIAIGSPVTLSGTVAEAADGSLGNRLDATQLRFTVRRNSNGAVAGTCTAPVTPTGPGTGASTCPVNLGLGLYTATIELVASGYYAAPPATSPTVIVVSVL